MHDFAQVLISWKKGYRIQYFVTTGYDSEWTDYTQCYPPQEQPNRLVWRVLGHA